MVNNIITHKKLQTPLKMVDVEANLNVSHMREIRSICKQGRLRDALQALYFRDQRRVPADSSTYASLLQECTNKRALLDGKLVHAHMIDTGFSPDILLGNSLVIMYAKCGSPQDAHQVLNQMPEQNVVSWTAIIAAYAKHGHAEEALKLFYQMQRTGLQPNHFTFASVLPACANLAVLKHGMKVHESIIRSGFQCDVFVESALVDMYIKCGSMDCARQVFDKMSERNVVSWTAIIAGYAREEQGEQALALFHQMQKTGVQPNQFTFASVLPACADLAALEHGKKVHGGIIRSGFQSDAFVERALLDMYVKSGSMGNAGQVFDRMSERGVPSWTAMIAGYAQNELLHEALKLFQKMPERDVVAWNAMIAGYAQNGHVEEALKLFQRMPELDVVSFNEMIAIYAQNGHIDEALKVFQKMPDRNVASWNAMITGCAQSRHVDEAGKHFQEMPARDVVSWNAMIAAYAQNGYVDEALNLFQKMPERNMPSWNAMIAGCAQNGHFKEALIVFKQMQITGVKPNLVTFASVLPACASLAALDHGKEVHEDIIRSGFQADAFIGDALVNMYAKCGSLEDARKVFDNLPIRSVVSWTAMIVGYAMHGCGMEALRLFKQMRCSGMKPNHVTFIGVLSACCHAGLVEDGCHYFGCMSQEYHMTPAVEHYCCMVDLLGRAGHLDDAEDLINKMPIKPNAFVWGSLLGACRIHGNVDVGERAAEHLFELEPSNAAHYVLLSNIYAVAGRWDDVENVRKMMKNRNVKKTPGYSWIEVNKKLYYFLGGDRSHPETNEIYAKLEGLSGQMKEAGYVPDKNFVLQDVEEEQKEHILYHHSEKLAIAFGLIHTSAGASIRIVKNLRVCGDCHSAIKFISKLVAQEILVRDSNRFHHFKYGQCSCGDYW